MTNSGGLFVGVNTQTRRVNWARVAIVAQFIRSTAPMSSDLRLSIVPLLDSIFAMLGVADFTILHTFNPWFVHDPQFLIPMGSFVNTRYFQAQLASPQPAAQAS